MDEEALKKLTQETLEAVSEQRRSYLLASEDLELNTIRNQVVYFIRKNTASLGVSEFSGTLGSNDLIQDVEKVREKKAVALQNLIKKVAECLDGEGVVPFVLTEKQRGDISQQILTDILDGVKQEVKEKTFRVKKEVSDVVLRVGEYDAGLIDTTAVATPPYVAQSHSLVDPNIALIDTTAAYADHSGDSYMIGGNPLRVERVSRESSRKI